MMGDVVVVVMVNSGQNANFQIAKLRILLATRVRDAESALVGAKVIALEIQGYSPMHHGENSQFPDSPRTDASELGFRRLAEFRHRIRQFLRFSEEAPRSKGIEPRQSIRAVMKHSTPERGRRR